MAENIIIEAGERISQFKIKVTKNILIRIKTLFTDFMPSREYLRINEILKEDNQYYEISVADFIDFFMELKEKIDTLNEPSTTLKVNEAEEIIVNFDIEKEEIEKLNAQYFEINKKDIMNNLKELETEQLEYKLDYYEKLFLLNKKMHKKTDLILLKFKLMESLKSIISFEQLNEIELKYNKLLEENNLELLEQFLVNLFKKNEVFLYMHPKKLFSGEYSEEEIKFILLHGYNYRINDVLNGKFNSYNMSSTINLLKDYKDNPILLKLFPGIDFVITLFPKVKITEEIAEKINNIKGIDFNKIYSCLNEYYKNQLNEDKITTDNELDILLGKKETLEYQYLEQQNLINRHRFFNKVINNEFYYNLTICDYNDTLDENQNLEKSIKNLEHELNVLRLDQEQYLEQQKKYENHKFINRNKLKKIKKELDIIGVKLTSLLNSKNTKELENIDLKNKLFYIKQKFKQDTDIDLLQYRKELENAKDIFNIYDKIRVLGNIYCIKQDLDVLQKQIDEILIKQKAINTPVFETPAKEKKYKKQI